MSRRIPPTQDEAKQALKAWAVLYARDLAKPKGERADSRDLIQLSDPELFAIEIGDPVETARQMRAEAAALGQVGEHLKDRAR